LLRALLAVAQDGSRACGISPSLSLPLTVCVAVESWSQKFLEVLLIYGYYCINIVRMRRGMTSTARGVSRNGIIEALQSLRAQNIPFKGPVQSRRGHHVVLIGNVLLLEAELIELLEKGELNSDGILKMGIRSGQMRD
jgi:hypothetical protein